MSFITRLSAGVAELGPLCVGIDPHPALLQQWGLDLDVTGLERMARTMAEAVAGTAALAKPQSAFFEVFGSAGIAVLERVLTDLAEGGVMSLLDAKRGDIGSTMTAYAQAYLAPGAPLAVDAITLNPYLGVGALQPALDLAKAQGRGVFLLARTSNPEAASVQRAVTDTGSVEQWVIDQAAKLNRDADDPYVGVVIGGTVDPTGLDLTGFTGPVLIPGFGPQGASAADLARRFAGVDGLLLPTASRAVIAAGPQVDQIRRQIADLQAQLAFAKP